MRKLAKLQVYIITNRYEAFGVRTSSERAYPVLRTANARTVYTQCVPRYIPDI